MRDEADLIAGPLNLRDKAEENSALHGIGTSIAKRYFLSWTFA